VQGLIRELDAATAPAAVIEPRLAVSWPSKAPGDSRLSVTRNPAATNQKGEATARGPALLPSSRENESHPAVRVHQCRC
jgi:hypothetical protein